MKKYGYTVFTVALVCMFTFTASCKSTAKQVKPTPTNTASSSPASPVPAEFEDLYTTLKTSLDRFDVYLKSKDTGTRFPVIFGAELLPANSNRGTELLKTGTLQGTILYLSRLQELGVQGVTINVAYPVYTPDFPQYQGYVDYFKQVAQEVRRRGMKLDVETGVIFHDTAFSTVKTDFTGLTLSKYESDMRRMVAAIINDLHPDYLNLGAEPDTHATLLGIKELNNPQNYTQFVNSVLAGLDRGTTKITAGIGTWSNLTFVEAMVKNTSLDCIAIHIYPVTGDYLTKAVSIAQIARQYNKSIVLDECWLYKTDNPATSGIAATAEIFRRDSFSFWEPLDEQFLASITKLCSMYNIEYVAPFWANFFFGNIDYNQATASLAYSDIIARANAVAVQNIIDGKFSALGEYYRKLIQKNR